MRVNEAASWFAPFPVPARRPLEVKCAESGRIRKQFSSMTFIMRTHDERGIPARP